MHKIFCVFMVLGSLTTLAACGQPTVQTTPSPPPLAPALVIYGWSEDEILSALDGFTEEYGVQLSYAVYESQEEAIDNIRAGRVYDLVIMDNQFIPSLVAEGLLAEIDHSHVPNFKNISANFRNLIYDPHNIHAIPYTWGTTGLLVRSDLVAEPATHWADLWDPRYAGRVALWSDSPRYLVGLTLLSLGYSANSENPAELEAALERLIEIKPNAIWLGIEHDTVAPLLVEGQAVLAEAWAFDALEGREGHEAVTYVLPKEGTMLWGDNLVIPANSPNKYTAELLLDYILRPEVTARIINVDGYPMPNQAALPYVNPELLNDTVVWPTNEELANSELLMPLSPEGEKLHQEIWNRFLAASP